MEIRELAYQNQAISDIIGCYEKNPLARVALVQPTGTGKTIVARKLIIDPRLFELFLKNKNRDYLRIVYKCHLDRLLVQARRRFDPIIVGESTIENWMDPNYKNTHRVEVCYQMFSQKLPDDADIDFIIYDECQHEACNTIQEFLAVGGKFPSLGMTATPDRPDNVLLKFDYIVEPITRKEAVEAGYICETDIITIVDTSSKNKVGLLKEILIEFNHEMKQTMIFVRTKKEINEVVNFIRNTLGELAEGCGDDDDVDDVLDRFATQEFKFLVSCNKLSEGIDVAGVTDVVIAKNVGSEIVLNQIIGRSARIDVPECRVWEFINVLSGSNIDSTDIVGKPRSHKLVNKVAGKFLVRDFDI